MPRQLIVSDITRPQPSSYFSKSNEGFMNWETAIWRFAAERSYWVATQGDTPHSMPVWGIWQDCAFRFSTHPRSRKSKNLRAHPEAMVHLGDTEAVLALHCRAYEISDERELQAFVNDYNPKYRWNFTVQDVQQGTFALTPYKAFAWAAGEGDAFHNTGTRWTLTLDESDE